MTDYDLMIDTGRAFYTRLTENNTKEWWEANRQTYDTILKPAAEALLTELVGPLSNIAGAPVRPKLFRPHRDVRFSKDKTPYKPHLHMLWQVEDAQAPATPAYFFGLAPDYVIAGGGILAFDKPVLENWRKFVDLDADRVADIFGGLAKAGFTLREPALKKVPPPYPADHPQADLLRMKACVATRPLGVGPVPDAILSAFRDLKPMNEFLLQVACA
ncbi:DUF2461 domain-containing protein [Loktanella sp. IMCC34160]|uniref:DUF2461 domain-containing protein n=1 Tax=Loktanella sp. IMCC34160 TaxID=2510646 RepID=UPI00101CE01D|nr:DUF2461 domain-containing protein [Loktanella sp. IMCC34160]RYG93030.1 DUF2461 domain-containing protein [Loktanella sp. IMCC34160]